MRAGARGPRDDRRLEGSGRLAHPLRVDTVALVSIGVYWIPMYEVLEQRGLKVWLVDARQMKR